MTRLRCPKCGNYNNFEVRYRRDLEWVKIRCTTINKFGECCDWEINFNNFDKLTDVVVRSLYKSMVARRASRINIRR